MAEAAETNVLEMSDEDFAKLHPPEIEEEETEPIEESEEESSEHLEAEPDNADTSTEESKESEEDTEDKEDDESEDSEESADTTADPDKEVTEEDKKKEPEPEDKAKTDYEAEYKKLLAPFKANGKQIQVENVDEAIRLMSMGANYHKKMASLKPALKIVKLLDHHGLMDESKINYLIDIHAKNPEAITQLLKESKIDPMEVDMEGESTYKPQARTISDKELQLDEVLESIQESDTYSRTLNVLTKEWDEPSQRTILDTPQLISFINEQMSTGDFDQVTSLVARERALGNLQGVSDIEAYYTMGQSLASKGHLKSQQSTEPTKSPVTSPPEKPGSSKEQVRKKKQAAAVTRTKPTSQKGTEVPNILAMSDEDFAKLSSPPYKQL